MGDDGRSGCIMYSVIGSSKGQHLNHAFNGSPHHIITYQYHFYIIYLKDGQHSMISRHASMQWTSCSSEIGMALICTQRQSSFLQKPLFNTAQVAVCLWSPQCGPFLNTFYCDKLCKSSHIVPINSIEFVCRACHT